MTFLNQKILAGAGLLTAVLAFGMGCYYDRDSYRDYGRYRYADSDRYRYGSYDRDDWRYRRDRQRDWDRSRDWDRDRDWNRYSSRGFDRDFD